MTNEQIFEEINSRKEKIRNILSNSNNFELNVDIVAIVKKLMIYERIPILIQLQLSPGGGASLLWHRGKVIWSL